MERLEDQSCTLYKRCDQTPSLRHAIFGKLSFSSQALLCETPGKLLATLDSIAGILISLNLTTGHILGISVIERVWLQQTKRRKDDFLRWHGFMSLCSWLFLFET